MSLDPVTVFGFAAVTAMMIFDTLEDYHPRWSLAFALSCFAGSLYAVLSHTWPFAIVEGFWGLMKLRHYWNTRPRWWEER